MKFFYLVLLSLPLLGCFDTAEKTSPPSDPNPPSIDTLIDHLDLTGAVGFMISDSSGATYKPSTETVRAAVSPADDNVSLEPNTLYKISETGVITKVPATNSHNERVDGLITPTNIIELDSRFLVMTFTDDDYQTKHYLVEKQTGKAYNANLDNSSRFLGDRDSNIFFQSSSAIWRINASQFGAPSLESRQIKVTTDGIASWQLPASGGFFTYNNNNYDAKLIRSSDGAITNLNTHTPGIVFNGGPNPMTVPGFVKGVDGELYALGYSGADFSNATVYRIYQDTLGDIQFESKGLLMTTTATGTTNMSADALTANHYWPTAHSTHKRFISGGKLFYWTSVIREGNPIEVDPVNATTRVVTSIAERFSLIEKIEANDSYYFVFGRDTILGANAIYRVDPQTDAITQLNVTNDYEVLDFRVLSNNKVWFKGTRYSDAATVIGEVDINGTITILDAIVNEPNIYIMLPISPADFITINGDAGDWHADLIKISDSISDTQGNAAAEITDIYVTYNSSDILILVKVAGSLADLQNQADLPVSEVFFNIALTATNTIQVAPSGVTGVANVNAAMGDGAVELRLPRSAISNPANLELNVDVLWDTGVSSMTYDTAGPVSIPLP